MEFVCSEDIFPTPFPFLFLAQFEDSIARKLTNITTMGEPEGNSRNNVHMGFNLPYDY